MKDRAADYILRYCFQNNVINHTTTIIESSSGNFGISLAAYCRKSNLKFICIIDPNISPINEMIIQNLGAKTIKVKELDKFEGYLLNRISKVKELLNKNENLYWVNQYENELNAEAYYQSLGTELCSEFNDVIDYAFIGVSSGGTITGLSKKIKETFPKAKIIAVDICGSVIFGTTPHKRFIPGIGSSMVPKILEKANIDEVFFVTEADTIKYCKILLKEHSIFAGGSSGSVFAAVNLYFADRKVSGKQNVVTIFPDRGERYYNTIYSDEWFYNHLAEKNNNKEIIV